METTMTTTTQKSNGLGEATSLLASALIMSHKSKKPAAPAPVKKGSGKKGPGPKEQQLAAMRMPADGSIPSFLDRTKGMTKEQIAASGDAARENAKRASNVVSMSRGLTSPAPKASNLTDADRKVIAELSKANADKKAEAKAVEKERLNKLAAAKKAEKAEIKAVKAAAKAANPKSGKTEKAAPKRKPTDRARYDWNGAREAAATGTIPAAPDFSANTHRCYRPLLAEVEKLVKAKDLAGLQAYRVKGSSTSPAAVKRYREIALVALKAKKA